MVQDKFPLETGGILVGKFIDDAAHIIEVIGPGPMATHRRLSFVRDADYSQIELDRYITVSDKELTYIGEWHSHPANVGASRTDISSMKWISHNPTYLAPTPVLLICCKKFDQWIPRAYQYVSRRLESIETEFVHDELDLNIDNVSADLSMEDGVSMQGDLVDQPIRES